MFRDKKLAKTIDKNARPVRCEEFLLSQKVTDLKLV